MSDKTPAWAAASRTTISADAVVDVIVANGVARLSLAITGPEGQPSPVGLLCIPVAQLPNVAAGLNNLLQQMQAKGRQAQPQQQQPARSAATPEADAAAADAAFRFNS